MTKFLELFTPVRKGNFGLTDEAVYRAIQSGGEFIPVFGGSQNHTTTDRFVSEHGKTKYEEPITIFVGDGVIVSLDGSSGCMTYVTSGKFALNHHAGFFQVKEEAKSRIMPEFFSLFFAKQLQEASISEGSKTLTIGAIESLDFNIPEYDVQKKVMLRVRPLLGVKSKLEQLIAKMSTIEERRLSVDYQSYQAKGVPISEVLECQGGNSGLTEEEIYHCILVEGPRYEVLSSSTTADTKLGMMPICNINGKRLKVFEGEEGILVIRNGKAGATYFLEKGKYTTTDHAYILTLKKDCQYRLSLKWCMNQYRQEFFEYTSSADNSTWNMTGFWENTVIDIPSYDEQTEAVKQYDYLESLRLRVERLLAKIDGLFARQIVS